MISHNCYKSCPPRHFQRNKTLFPPQVLVETWANLRINCNKPKVLVPFHFIHSPLSSRKISHSCQYMVQFDDICGIGENTTYTSNKNYYYYDKGKTKTIKKTFGKHLQRHLILDSKTLEAFDQIDEETTRPSKLWESKPNYCNLNDGDIWCPTQPTLMIKDTYLSGSNITNITSQGKHQSAKQSLTEFETHHYVKRLWPLHRLLK